MGTGAFICGSDFVPCADQVHSPFTVPAFIIIDCLLLARRLILMVIQEHLVKVDFKLRTVLLGMEFGLQSGGITKKVYKGILFLGAILLGTTTKSDLKWCRTTSSLIVGNGDVGLPAYITVTFNGAFR